MLLHGLTFALRTSSYCPHHVAYLTSHTSRRIPHVAYLTSHTSRRIPHVAYLTSHTFEDSSNRFAVITTPFHSG